MSRSSSTRRTIRYWAAVASTARFIARPGRSCWPNAVHWVAVKPARPRLTPGYRLTARHVIHTVGPIYSGTPRDAQLLASAVRNSLRLATEHHLKSIAFPAISTGIYGYPMADAAHVILSTISDYLKDETSLERVVVCLYDRRALNVFEAALAQI